MDSTVRLDKYLWAARFYKTRSLAQTQIERNKVRVNNELIKPSRSVKVGDEIWLEQGDSEKTVIVKAVSESRGSAPVAQTLYEETAASIISRDQSAAKRKLFTEPASLIKGRPTKRDRRTLNSVSGGYSGES
jgi:ribosome-associated heat shock protein Hsp15